MSNEVAGTEGSLCFGNIPAGSPEPTAWPLDNPVLYTLIWIALIIAVFAPLSIRRYTRAAHRR